MLVIRLQRRGKKNQPFFWIVVAEKTAPVRGKFIEKVGFWNPTKKEKGVNGDRVKYWISKGAKPSDSVQNLLIDYKVIEGEKTKIKILKKKIKEEKKAGDSKIATRAKTDEEKGVNKEELKEKKTQKKIQKQEEKKKELKEKKEGWPVEEKSKENKK